MAAVNVLAVRVLNNPARFGDPLAFEIEYEAVSNLQDDLTWRLVYVGSAETSDYDQELENVAVGPVTQGNFKFVLEANPPDPAKIPADDIVGVTVILLTCSYRGQEFIRVGYYVSNEYTEEELRDNPPETPLLDRLQRSILADHPRVTRFAIPFDEPEPQPDQNMDVGMGEMDMGAADQAGMSGVDAGHDGMGGAGQQSVADPMGAYQAAPGGEMHMHQQQHYMQYTGMVA